MVIKHITILTLISISFISCKSPKEIVDYGGLSVLVGIHQKEQQKYEDIKNQEIQKTGLQLSLHQQQSQLTELTEKIQKRYKTASSIIHSVGKTPYAIEIINDIKKYHFKIKSHVIEDPKLIVLGIKTEIAVLKKINRLYKFIYSNAIIANDFNLMSIEQRLEIIDTVIENLRDLRGMVYGIELKIRYAIMGDAWKKILQEYNINLSHLNSFEKTSILKNMKVW